MKTRILFLDKDAQELEVLRRTLSLRAGLWDLQFEAQPDAAWTRLREEPFDLLVCDARMADWAGIRLLRKVRADEQLANLPVIVVMDREDIDAKIQAFDLQATDWLADPIDEHDFAFRVRNVVKLTKYERRAKALGQELASLSQHFSAELGATHLDLVLRLARAAEVRENRAGDHMLRVARISRAIAVSLEMEERFVQLLFLATPLHDIGKIGIPDEVLLKEGQLDEQEWVIMRKHCKIGAEILQEDAQFWDQIRQWGGIERDSCLQLPQDPVIQMAKTICLTHHERWDGGGYPQGLRGEEIPLESRIVALADVFDALRSHRVYKAEMGVEETLAALEKRVGRDFDPRVYQAFLACIEEVRQIDQESFQELAV